MSLTRSITLEFAIVDEMIPAVKMSYHERNTEDVSCILARIQFFNNGPGRKRLASQVWARLRLIDRSLKPWNIDETIATRIPQVFDKDHFMQTRCFWCFLDPNLLQGHEGLQKTRLYLGLVSRP